MRLVIWTIHSMTLETDKWKHESTDWDINIWMKRDARNQFISGSSPKWRSKGKMTGNLRIEHFPASFSMLVKKLRPTLLSFSSSYLPFFPHRGTRTCTPSSIFLFLLHQRTFRDFKGSSWWQLELVGLGSRTNIITPQNNLWARLWGV